ncbi:glycosyltransferase [Rhodobacteraceae bacterium B1Z28]|uniref:Glycosyltransferase n=1 Tax=Ruegeria haliotis TaxID=2747601 RepID=A0ABX2PT41_9RHOB|nr:glycosyltransferase [Ruegeria haliotis]NVO57340.1 glycosyltransferase [Ruegeria haliotis]
MKICFCVSSFPALSQTFVTSQVLHAVRQGHQVTVACKSFDHGTPLAPDQEHDLHNVRIVIWPPKRPDFLRTLPTRLSDRMAARLDRSAWRRQIDADIVVAHFGYRGAAVERAQRGWKRRPRLVTVYHGRDVSVEYQRDAMSRFRNLFAEGDLHVTVNAQFGGCLVECGAPKARVETRHLGIPVSKYPFSTPSFHTPMRFLSVCRLVQKKGLGTAIEALALLRDRQPDIDWRYDIGGDGPLLDELRAKVMRKHLQDRITFLGALPHQNVLRRMTDADVMLVPSCTADDGDQEGIPVTLMEAMALGTLVCTTRHSGIPELVEHGETGLLSDERDAEGLYRNILFLAQDSDWATILADAARHKILSDFNEDRQNLQFLERCHAIL